MCIKSTQPPLSSSTVVASAIILSSGKSMALRQILVMISRSGQCLDKQKVVVLGVNLPTREIVTRAAPLYAVLWRNGCCLNRLDGCAEQW